MPYSRLRRARPQRSSSSSIESDDETAKQFASMSLSATPLPSTTPRRMPPSSAKKVPVSARRSGLDGDGWERTAAADDEIIIVSENDSENDSWLVSDDDDSSISLTPAKTAPTSPIMRPEHEPRDLTAPTPKKVIEAFAADRDESLEEKFREFDKALTQNKLSHRVQCIWSKRLRTTAGQTRLIRKNDIHTAIIELSTRVIDSPLKLESTLAHEFCHAAAWILDHTAKPPHGRAFKIWAKKIQNHFPEIIVTTRHRYYIQYEFKWRCQDPDCSFIVQRHSNSIHPDTHFCPRCASRLIRLTN